MTIRAYRATDLSKLAGSDWANQNSLDLLDDIANRARLLPPSIRILAASRLASTVDAYLKSTENETWISKRLWELLLEIGIQLSLADEGFFNDEINAAAGPSTLENTSTQFGFFWPKTSESSRTELDEMAYLRLLQIGSYNMDFKEIIARHGFLDIGCGPGRYIRSARKMIENCRCLGIDASEAIVDYNNKNNDDNLVEYVCDDLLANSVSSQYGMVMCNGVAHHTTHRPETFIAVHASKVIEDGFYFVFMYGNGGLELKTWEALQTMVHEVPVEVAYNTLKPFISPLRLQGQLDHMYGVFYRSNPEEIGDLLQTHFSTVTSVEGVNGLDVTASTMKHLSEEEFRNKFGTGNIRFICRK